MASSIDALPGARQACAGAEPGRCSLSRGCRLVGRCPIASTHSRSCLLSLDVAMRRLSVIRPGSPHEAASRPSVRTAQHAPPLAAHPRRHHYARLGIGAALTMAGIVEHVLLRPPKVDRDVDICAHVGLGPSIHRTSLIRARSPKDWRLAAGDRARARTTYGTIAAIRGAPPARSVGPPTPGGCTRRFRLRGDLSASPHCRHFA
jgi:hypothetical protein